MKDSIVQQCLDILKREDVQVCFKFTHSKMNIFKTICDGGLANESLFAIILSITSRLTDSNVKKYITHLTDWSRMTSPTSPYFFTEGSQKDIKLIKKNEKFSSTTLNPIQFNKHEILTENG